jgi:glyoxylase-like metal-dependent hydrolase (beta-lactamase superfamily II)
MEIIVVSIGTLSRNPLWGEKAPVRTSHATTTLIRTGGANLLVDPSLPAPALEQRIFERSGLKAGEITHVFLTNWKPVHRRALGLFGKALWLMHESEIQAGDQALSLAQRHDPDSAGEDKSMLESERRLLDRVKAAPDKPLDGVDLFPLCGYTPGQCGLLVNLPTHTVILAGDAVPTAGHFTAGQVFPDCFDLHQAQESLAELYEIADLIVPGHDNIFVNPRSAGI